MDINKTEKIKFYEHKFFKTQNLSYNQILGLFFC